MTTKAKHDKGTAATTVSALSAPFSTGGGGVDFEHRVQATFLLALLVEGFSPLLNLPITSVLFQGKRSGHDIDDVVIISSCDEYIIKKGEKMFTAIIENEGNTLVMEFRASVTLWLTTSALSAFVNRHMKSSAWMKRKNRSR